MKVLFSFSSSFFLSIYSLLLPLLPSPLLQYFLLLFSSFLLFFSFCSFSSFFSLTRQNLRTFINLHNQTLLVDSTLFGYGSLKCVSSIMEDHWYVRKIHAWHLSYFMDASRRGHYAIYMQSLLYQKLTFFSHV